MLRKSQRTKHDRVRSEVSGEMAGIPFLVSHSHLPNSAPEHPKKYYSGTNEQVGRWPRLTSDPRRCILEGTEFREK